jgi:hypothetical protein
VTSQICCNTVDMVSQPDSTYSQQQQMQHNNNNNLIQGKDKLQLVHN